MVSNATTDATIAPRVFISYVHWDGPEGYRERVLALTQRLRASGVEAVLDQFYETTPPPQGWPRWMLDEIKAADFVLVVCTATYYRRFAAHEAPGLGLGGVWEGGVITQALYEAGGHNRKFIPIGFAGHGAVAPHIPEPLRPTTYRDVSTDDGFTKLLRQIYNAPEVVPEALGQRPQFAPIPSPAASGRVPVNPAPSVPSASAPSVSDRTALIGLLQGMDPTSYTRIVPLVPGALPYDLPNQTVPARVQALLSYAESSVGPRIDAVAQAVVLAFPHLRSRLGPFT